MDYYHEIVPRCNINGFFAFASAIIETWNATYSRYGKVFNETWAHVPTPLTKTRCERVEEVYGDELQVCASLLRHSYF